MTSPLAADRIQAVISEWLDTIAGIRDPVWQALRLHDFVSVDPLLTWVGLPMYFGALNANAPGVLPLVTEGGVYGAAALVYSYDPVNPPRMELVTIATSGVTVEQTITAPLGGGWHVLLWESDGIEVGGTIRIIAGAAGDMFAGGAYAVAAPP